MLRNQNTMSFLNTSSAAKLALMLALAAAGSVTPLRAQHSALGSYSVGLSATEFVTGPVLLQPCYAILASAFNA